MVLWFAHRSRTNIYPQRQQKPDKPLASVAVLPFESLSADTEQWHFADGMTEALLAELAKVRELRVVSRTSTVHYKGTRQPLREIAQELKTSLIVTGSVTPSGRRAIFRLEDGITLRAWPPG
jgi:TolB-like protein